MNKDSKIYVAGHHGLVGSAIYRRLEREGYTRLITRSHEELDLIESDEVARFFEREKPEYVFLAAAKVGGILANNTYPADFIHQNLVIQTNVIQQAWRHKVKRLLFLGSACIYPRECPQPMKEEYLLTGPLEPTNEAYAVAKIAGITMCQSYNRQYGTRFLAVMPTNLYGPSDNFDLESSHVIPALIRKAHEAKQQGMRSMAVWGTGTARRTFLHVDDSADACYFLMRLPDERFDNLIHRSVAPALVNIGCGEDLTIRDLVETIRKVVGFQGLLKWDMTKPDGMPQKSLDVSIMTELGWRPRISLQEGLKQTYHWFVTRSLAA